MLIQNTTPSYGRHAGLRFLLVIGVIKLFHHPTQSILSILYFLPPKSFLPADVVANYPASHLPPVAVEEDFPEHVRAPVLQVGIGTGYWEHEESWTWWIVL